MAVSTASAVALSLAILVCIYAVSNATLAFASVGENGLRPLSDVARERVSKILEKARHEKKAYRYNAEKDIVPSSSPSEPPPLANDIIVKSPDGALSRTYRYESPSRRRVSSSDIISRLQQKNIYSRYPRQQEHIHTDDNYSPEENYIDIDDIADTSSTTTASNGPTQAQDVVPDGIAYTGIPEFPNVSGYVVPHNGSGGIQNTMPYNGNNKVDDGNSPLPPPSAATINQTVNTSEEDTPTAVSGQSSAEAIDKEKRGNDSRIDNMGIDNMVTTDATDIEDKIFTGVSPRLSEETMRILGSLPEDVTGIKPRFKRQYNVEIDRKDPSRSIADDSWKTHIADGMDVRVRKRPVNIGYNLEKAYKQLEAGNTENAIRIYREILEDAPNDEEALFGLATTYHRIGMLDEARTAYGKLLASNPHNIEALNNFLGLVGEESPQDAIFYMEKIHKKNPFFSPIVAQLSILYQRIGDKKKAIEYMLDAVNISPENLVYKYNLAVLYDEYGAKEEAIALYRELIEASMRGQKIPANPDELHERLIFLSYK